MPLRALKYLPKFYTPLPGRSALRRLMDRMRTMVFSSTAVVIPVIRPPTHPFTDVWDNISPPAVSGRSGGKLVVFRFALTGRPCPPVLFRKFRYSKSNFFRVSPSQYLVPLFGFPLTFRAGGRG